MSHRGRHVTIAPAEHRLRLFDGEQEVGSFPIATARYTETPKLWSNDYRNAAGVYRVTRILTESSPELCTMNSHHIPWYLSPTARDPYEDAGLNLYGMGMIVTDYPNREDLHRYSLARKTGELRRIWEGFCRHHLQPIYRKLAQDRGIPFDEVVVATDYGERTYLDALQSCPILDEKIAFDLGVAIHGTNDPGCIGASISAGCIRMHNENILRVMAFIEEGTVIEFEASDFYSL